MKWEKLKDAVADYVEANPAEEGSQYIKRNAAYEQKSVRAYLDTIDIRRAGALREHARPAFPKYMQRRTLRAQITCRGWSITV